MSSIINIGTVRMAYIKYYQKITIRAAYAIDPEGFEGLSPGMGHHMTEYREARDSLLELAGTLQDGAGELLLRNRVGKHFPACCLHVRALVKFMDDQLEIVSSCRQVLKGIGPSRSPVDVMKITRRIDRLELSDYQMFEVERRIVEFLLEDGNVYEKSIKW